MGTDFEKREWETPAYEEKNRLLFLRQKRLLDMLFERNAISKVQYEKKPYRSDIGNGVKCRSDQGRMMNLLIFPHYLIIPPAAVFEG